MKKFFGIVIVIAIVVFAGWAYMNSGTPENPAPTPTPTPTPVQTAEPTPEIVTPAPTPEEQKLSATAIYTGKIDSNSIEININGNPIEAKLSPQLKSSFDSLNIEEESSVTIEYTLEKEVYVVHKISKN